MNMQEAAMKDHVKIATILTAKRNQLEHSLKYWKESTSL